MSELKKNEAVSAPKADALAQISRKDAFLQQLQEFLTAHKEEKWCVAALDIEHFKLYNKLCGAEQGTALLQQLAQHLLDYCTPDGIPVGYWGNDDFVVCLPDDKEKQLAIIGRLQTSVNTKRQDVTFFLTFGLCPVAEHPDADVQTLCNYAQIAAMDPNPAVGGVHRFTPAMLNDLKEQQQLLNELEHALANHEFCFFLQPKCNSMTRAIVGMEALVRWNHPTRGCVPPAEFMPLLESTGLVTQLDQYIWESVCQTLQKWQENDSNLVPVSVNVSVVDIVNLDVPQIFSDLVEKYQLEPKLLVAEITETMVAENAALVENTIQGLHRKGFSVMMDDFGSGYSSLNMLKDTNVDAIKLDMAHRLNLPIIAEGVETPEQVSMLQAADCLYTQGYYFFKPMPVENAEELLAQPNSADYWDMHRDLIRRDRHPVDTSSAQTALALQAYQIFADNVLELSLLNLATGEYRVVKRDPRLPGTGKEEDFAAYCDRLVADKIIHPDDAEMFTDQTDLDILRSTIFHTQQPEAYRFRKNVSGQFVWITMEFIPCRSCSAQNPWTTVLVREDMQANQLSEELDFSYSHDSLTGLLNRSRYETDLRELQFAEYDSIVCTYIDVVGLSEVNNHLGHRSGDSMLCCIANAIRKFVAASRIYRVGGDEFVILTPNQPPYSVWVSVDRMRSFLREKEYEISVGIQNVTDLHKLDSAVSKAEAAMQDEKQAYYARNGQQRQIRGLNEKLEKTLVEKQDAEHFLRVLAPKYRGVYVVDLQDDSSRSIIVPGYFQKMLDTSGGSFKAAFRQYCDTQVEPADREALNDLFDYDFIRSKVLVGDIVEHTYKKTDGTVFRVKVTPYSSSGVHIHETIWIFADVAAPLTPPPTKQITDFKKQRPVVRLAVVFCFFQFFQLFMPTGFPGTGPRRSCGRWLPPPAACPHGR